MGEYDDLCATLGPPSSEGKACGLHPPKRRTTSTTQGTNVSCYQRKQAEKLRGCYRSTFERSAALATPPIANPQSVMACRMKCTASDTVSQSSGHLAGRGRMSQLTGFLWLLMYRQAEEYSDETK